MRKTKLEAEKTRQHLLDAALEVFWRKGVTSASLQEIAEEAGVTRGALYWHFANKEALFEALFVRQQADFIAFFDERTLRESADVWEHTRQSLIAVCRAICEDARQYKFCSVMFLKCEQTESNRTIYGTCRTLLPHIPNANHAGDAAWSGARQPVGGNGCGGGRHLSGKLFGRAD